MKHRRIAALRAPPGRRARSLRPAHPCPLPTSRPSLQVIRGASIITIEALERVDRGP